MIKYSHYTVAFPEAASSPTLRDIVMGQQSVPGVLALAKLAEKGSFLLKVKEKPGQIYFQIENQKTPAAFRPPGFSIFGAGNGIRKLPVKFYKSDISQIF